MREDTLLVGIDGGGTFTDVTVLFPGGQVRTFKVPSTPSNPADAIMEALELAKMSRDDLARSVAGGEPGKDAAPVQFVTAIGTTIATNTVLERKGARVAFVAVNNYVFGLSRCISRGFPLSTRRKTAASASTKIRFFDFVKHLLGRHL